MNQGKFSGKNWARRFYDTCALFIIFLALLSAEAGAQTLPDGFLLSKLLPDNSLASPTAMAFAPDGRLFVCEKGGTLRIIENGVLLSQPFLTLYPYTNVE